MYRRIILSNSPVFEFSIFSWYNFNFVVRYSNSQKNVHKMKIKNAFLRWFLKLFQYALKISTKNATMLLSLPEFLNSLLFSFSLSLKIYFFLNRISRGSGRFSMHLNFFWKLPNIWKWSRNKATLSLSLSLIYMLNWVHIERREWLIVVREFFAIKWTWREGKFCYSLVYQGEIFWALLF